MTKLFIAAFVLMFAFGGWLPAQAKQAPKHDQQSHASEFRAQKDQVDECGDPNWDCCISYYRGGGPGACGR
jgi:hypothetical protein